MPRVVLSKFLCKELVYDYLTGKLDPKRRQVFQDYAIKDTELKKLLDSQKNAFRYLGELKKADLSEAYFKHLCALHEFDFIETDESLDRSKDESPKLSEEALEADAGLSFSEKYRQQIYVLRRTAEALGLAALVFVVIKVLPDQFFRMDEWFQNHTVLVEETIFSEGPEQEGQDTTEDNEEVQIAANDTAASEEEFVRENESSAISGKKNLKETAASEEKDVSEESSPTANETKETVASEKKEEAPVKFYLYRSVVYVDDYQKVSGEFLKYLQKVGAKKAGQVQLGWEKPQARYFHFHINEKEEENIRNFFSSRTKFQLRKINHWRKTPENKIRVIVEIRQQK